MAATRNVIVAGAGIGGLVSALALTRAGFRATVIEQAPRIEESGAGIQLSPNATRILMALGLAERLSITAVEPNSVRVMSGISGREIVRIPLGPFAERRYGAPYWVIHRGDLQNVLLAAAQANQDITLKLGTRLEDFAAHSNGVSVQVRRAGHISEEEGIALIGADGLWSTVRTRLGRQGAPVFRHRTAWRALVPAQNVAAAWREPTVHLWLGLDSHLVHYPVKGGALINIVGIADDEWQEAGWSATGEREDVLRHFARWSWAEPARTLVAAPERWSKWALFDRTAPMRGSGPVTLIGDAAHPMLPFLAQGGAMAIEDAVVLAACLGANGDNPVKALRAYEKARRKRTGKVQKLARKQGNRYAMTGPEALIRNFLMRRMGGQRLLARHDWIYGWKAPVFDSADRYVRPLGGEEAEEA